MNTRDYMELEFPSISENERFARSVVAAYASRLDPTVEELDDIKTAVSEAVTNAIVHGYGGRSDGVVRLKASLARQTLCITVCDRGAGIPDVAQAMQPFYTTYPEGERSGMGFTVMETFMDEVQVTSRPGEGTEVSMRKTLSAPLAAEETP